MMKILVATDLTPESSLAEQRAQSLARFLPASLRRVHVREGDDAGECDAREGGGPSSGAQPASPPQADEQSLETLAGDPRELVTRLARDASLLVLGEPRRRTAAGLFTGTTGEQIIRRSEVPVLVARTQPSPHYQRVLLAVDLSSHSLDIMRACKALGLDAGRLHVLHAYRTPQVDLMIKTSAYSFEEVRQNMAARKRKHLNRLRQLMNKAKLAGTAEVRAITGSAAAEILGVAKKHQAELIVVGSRRRSNLAKLVLGSVAAQVLSHATADVLIVPPAPEPELGARRPA